MKDNNPIKKFVNINFQDILNQNDYSNIELNEIEFNQESQSSRQSFYCSSISDKYYEEIENKEKEDNNLNFINDNNNNEKIDSEYYDLNEGKSIIESNVSLNDSFINEKLINELEKKDNTKKKHIFNIEPQGKKRGRKTSKNNTKKTHSKLAYDNMLTKIQTHFFKFLVQFINDIILQLLKKNDFLAKLAYSEKSKVSKGFIDELKNYSIRDIFNNFNISNKYNKDENINRRRLKYLFKSEFKSLFEQLFDIKP